MSDFEFKKYVDKDTITIKLSGRFDEEAHLEKIDVSKYSHFILDMSGVSFINSVGLRGWLLWISNLSPKNKITFIKCPKLFIDQGNMIERFLPSWSKFESFLIPYFCPQCNDTTTELIQNKGEGLAKTFPETVKCSKCGNPAEIDIRIESYEKFLK